MLGILGAIQPLKSQFLKYSILIMLYHLLSMHPEGFSVPWIRFLCTTGAEVLYSDKGHCGREKY
jgi:KUP system potassium uptake protein